MQHRNRRARILAGVLLPALLASLIACTKTTTSVPAVTKPQFSRTPAVADWSSFRKTWTTPPAKPANAQDPFAVDLRLADLSGVDLRQSSDVLMNYASFDTETKWPSTLPTGYDPKQIMERGKNPGLGLRDLHKEGVTGRGVHVAFIDQTLLLGHEEYQGRILKYNEIGEVTPEAAMHGAAVTSILAGKTVGVAPDVTLTYYAVQFGNGEKKRTFTYLAQAINQILDDNARLPAAEKIRVIGASIGWSPNEEGYAEIDKAVKRAAQEGVFVISSSVEQYYSLKFHGLDRDPLADPENYRSYRPGTWWRDDYYREPTSPFYSGRVLVPMDARTTAAPTGTSAYAFYREGGWSWCIPYLEGVYAMGLQVRPNLTPDEFYKAALETGSYAEFSYNGKTYRLGPIINPAGLIKSLRKL